jgi:hypothetical protein
MFSKPSCGLVIRANEVELLAMQGPRVLSRVRVPIEGSEREDLGRAVRQAVAAAGFKPTTTAVALPTEEVLVRCFSMPPLPPGEREAAIQFEARKYIPFRMEGLVWEFHAVEVKDPPKLDVVFLAIQREVLQTIREVLEEAGVEPVRMEPRSVSLSRLAAKAGGRGAEGSGFVCVVEMAQHEAHLVIAKGGVPYLTRDVHFAGEGGTAGPSGGGAKSESDFQRLVSELRVSLDFFTREHPATVISKVILVGEEERVASWHPALVGALGSLVEVGRTLLGRRLGGELPLSLASAVGLLKGRQEAHGGAAWGDLLRRSLTEPSRAGGRRIPPVIGELARQFSSARGMAVGAMAAGILFLVWLFGWHQVGTAQGRLAELIRQRPMLIEPIPEVDDEGLAALTAQVQERRELLRRLVVQRVGVTAKLDALPRVLSDGMWLTGLAFEEWPDEAGRSRLSLKANGACYLAQAGKELGAIRAFEDGVKRHAELVSGFTVARVEQINEQAYQSGRRTGSYRTFQLHCRSDARL